MVSDKRPADPISIRASWELTQHRGYYWGIGYGFGHGDTLYRFPQAGEVGSVDAALHYAWLCDWLRAIQEDRRDQRISLRLMLPGAALLIAVAAATGPVLYEILGRVLATLGAVMVGIFIVMFMVWNTTGHDHPSQWGQLANDFRRRAAELEGGNVDR